MDHAISTADPAPAFFSDGRRKVRLPGDERLHSDFAADIGDALATANIFSRGGSAFTVDAEARCLRIVTADFLRTWVEQHLVCYKIRAESRSGSTITLRRTMSLSDADAVLAAPQFLDRLQPINRVNAVQMPVVRTSGWLELLPTGYDSGSQTFTLSDGPPVIKLDLDMATSTISELLSEFCFADGERSRAVALASMLSVYGAQLLPANSLRPCFVLCGNSEGCGKTLLVKLATVPVLGAAPVGTRASDDDEMQKVLLSAILEGRSVLLLDNLKGHLSSAALEAFLSCQTYSGRILGHNKSFAGQNNVTVFVTGNGLTVSPDMRRRSLFIELHLPTERAEDRIFKNRLEVPQLLEKRMEILSSLWTLTKAWFDQMQPKPSRTHSAFPDWCDIIAGIVEFSGIGCPLEPPAESLSPDTDGADMRALVRIACTGSTASLFAFDELVTLCAEHGLFERLVNERGELDHKQKATLANLFRRYDRRQIGDFHFELAGKGRNRRYQITRKAEHCHGVMV